MHFSARLASYNLNAVCIYSFFAGFFAQLLLNIGFDTNAIKL